MPTSNPRINVTLSPSLDVLVARLAGLQRVSKAAILRELLEIVEPSLHRLVEVMEVAESGTPQVGKALAEAINARLAGVDAVLALGLKDADRAVSDLVSSAELIAPRRPRRATAGRAPRSVPPANPPASNRGVKSRAKAIRRGAK